MILVQGIGISGYVPLEGTVGLSHFLLDYQPNEGKYEYRYGFHYTRGNNVDRTHKLEILRSVVSFAVMHRFDDSVRSTIVHDVGLLSGYYRAGAIFPNKLRYILRDVVDLNEYYILPRPSYHPNYHSLKFVYTSAWYEYICLGPDVSYDCTQHIFICVLDHKNPFPGFVCGELCSASVS